MRPPNPPVPTIMNRRTLTTLLSLALLTSLTACKKPADTTPPDDVAGPVDSDSGGEVEEPVEQGPPQEPDPAEIAEARTNYLIGEYQKVTATLEPMMADLVEREQYNASSQAGAWVALAHVHDLVESAKAPAETSVAMAEKSDDKTVKALAKIAHGGFLHGSEDFAAAKAAFEEALSLDPTGPNAALARIMSGHNHISMAFGEEDKITNPEEFDTAVGEFEKAKGLAGDDKMLLGRAAEGLAAAQRYKGDNKAACAAVAEAAAAYEEGGASAYTKDGAVHLKQAAGCK